MTVEMVCQSWLKAALTRGRLALAAVKEYIEGYLDGDILGFG